MHSVLRMAFAVCLAVLAGVGGGARGQDAGEGGGTGPAVVELRVVRVGPGGLARRGSWAGVLVELQDRGLRQREVILRLATPDRDGDEARFDRVVASNPGFAQSFWLYARMPTGSGGLEVTALEAVEVPATGDEPEGLRGFAPGATLARAGVDLSRAAPPGEGLYGVVGSAGMGLDRYAGIETGSGGERSSPAGHESTRVSVGLTVSELPDRWQIGRAHV